MKGFSGIAQWGWLLTAVQINIHLDSKHFNNLVIPTEDEDGKSMSYR